MPWSQGVQYWVFHTVGSLFEPWFESLVGSVPCMWNGSSVTSLFLDLKTEIPWSSLVSVSLQASADGARHFCRFLGFLSVLRCSNNNISVAPVQKSRFCDKVASCTENTPRTNVVSRGILVLLNTSGLFLARYDIIDTSNSFVMFPSALLGHAMFLLWHDVMYLCQLMCIFSDRGCVKTAVCIVHLKSSYFTDK